MSTIVDYECNSSTLEKISEWNYGINWPVVYIYYNNKKAYVGETLDASRRFEQHLQEPQFDDFSNICIITNKTFNKSVILDLESYLIRYISADGSKQLINGNAGVSDHNYFYKEAYEDDFVEIWNALLERGIVSKSISAIENSELFKYSPYKSLNSEQQKAAYNILNLIYKMNDATSQSLIEVSGGAGTGKTILAVYIIKLLVDINNNKEVWKSIDDKSEANLIERISKDLSGIRSIGFVVPMIELRNTMKKIFDSIEGLSSKMVYAPEEVALHSYFDILVCDEAHRLYQNKHLPQGATNHFKRINQALMGDGYQNNENDLTELDWIIRSSRLQLLFYDSRQAIRTPDISKEKFESICRPRLYKYIELYSQMRCKGGNGYYEYVRKVLESTNLSKNEYLPISDYKIQIVDQIDELIEFIEYQNREGNGLCKVIAGPGWNIKEDICIEDKVFHWAGSSLENDIIYSIHKTQGFDLNYAGVIFGREVSYDSESGRIEVVKSCLKDNYTKSNGDEMMRKYVIDIYLTLMTRGIYGTYLYVMDEELKEYLKKFFA